MVSEIASNSINSKSKPTYRRNFRPPKLMLKRLHPWLWWLMRAQSQPWAYQNRQSWSLVKSIVNLWTSAILVKILQFTKKKTMKQINLYLTINRNSIRPVLTTRTWRQPLMLVNLCANLTWTLKICQSMRR